MLLINKSSHSSSLILTPHSDLQAARTGNLTILSAINGIRLHKGVFVLGKPCQNSKIRTKRCSKLDLVIPVCSRPFCTRHRCLRACLANQSFARQVNLRIYQKQLYKFLQIVPLVLYASEPITKYILSKPPQGKTILSFILYCQFRQIKTLQTFIQLLCEIKPNSFS